MWPPGWRGSRDTAGGSDDPAIAMLLQQQQESAQHLAIFEQTVIEQLQAMNHNINALRHEHRHAEHHSRTSHGYAHEQPGRMSSFAHEQPGYAHEQPGAPPYEPASPSESLLEEEMFEEDPWQVVLRGDSQVQTMIKELRREEGTGFAFFRKKAVKPASLADVVTKASSPIRRNATNGRWLASAPAPAPAPAPLGSESSTTEEVPALPAPGCTAVAANAAAGCMRWAGRLVGRCGTLVDATLPVLHPSGRFRSIWNLLMATLILYCGAMVPFEVAFETSMKQEMGAGGWQRWEIFNLVIDCLFVCDVMLSFRTGVTVSDAMGGVVTGEEQVVMDGRSIAIIYLRGSFVFDMIGSFPISFLVLALGSDDDESVAASRLNRQLRLLRIAKLNRLLRLSKLRERLKYNTLDANEMDRLTCGLP